MNWSSIAEDRLSVSPEYMKKHVVINWTRSLQHCSTTWTCRSHWTMSTGHIESITNRNHSLQVIIQIKFMTARKHLRGKQPTVFISEDLTQKRAKFLYLCREKKRKHPLQDCWSYDERTVIKNMNGRIKTIIRDEDLNEL